MLLSFSLWKKVVGCRVSLDKDRVSRSLLERDLEGMGGEKVINRVC